ncbi:MAG: metallophosphoesterase family protein [Vicinamibacterales bacterium]
MRYLILSDVHGNIQALDAVLTDAASRGYDATLCLGDLVGYGGSPQAVLDRVSALDPVGLIRGNHDKVCAGLDPPTFFNELARRAIEWTRAVLDPAALAALATLQRGPLPIVGGLAICHGAPFDEDYYILDPSDADRALQGRTGVWLFGHTHVPAVYICADDLGCTSAPLQDHSPMRLPDAPCLINVGAVGQPRDRDPRASYGLLDWDARTIELCRVVYDIKGAQQAIVRAGLPMWLAVRLEAGQ